MKKILALVLAMFLVATLFTACRESNTVDDSEKDSVVEVAYADLVQVPGYDYLYYSITDNTVYYLFDKSKYMGDKATGLGFFGPYIRNGHNCEYLNGQIVEIIPTVRIEDTTN